MIIMDSNYIRYQGSSIGLVREFEDLLEKVVYGMEERAEIQTLAIKCLPCVHILEILEVAIFL